MGQPGDWIDQRWANLRTVSQFMHYHGGAGSQCHEPPAEEKAGLFGQANRTQGVQSISYMAAIRFWKRFGQGDPCIAYG